MLKNAIIKFLLSMMLLMYLVFALGFTSHQAMEDTCNGLLINVVDSTSRGFVTSEDIALDLGPMYDNIRNTRFDSINTHEIERIIMGHDNIEHVNCHILNNRSLRIDVTPLIPVARVFDTHGENYYINRAGKQMRASTQYRMDVPVIIGTFNGRITPQMAFDLIDYLDEHPDWGNITSAIEVMGNGDLIFVPKIKGHVVNLGDASDLDNKFERLNVFYHKVMKMKGWEYYDTISVKWRGQIVAKQRHTKAPTQYIPVEEHDDLDDEGTMLTNVNEQTNT